MLMKLLMVSGVVALVIVFVRSRPGVRLRAGKRIGIGLFALLNLYAILRPEDVSGVARLLGVGRGTDLVLYALAMAFLLNTLLFYLRIKENDRRFTALARTIAIREAEVVNRERHLGARSRAVALPAPRRTREDLLRSGGP